MFVSSAQYSSALYSQAPQSIMGVSSAASMNLDIDNKQASPNSSQLNSQTARPVNFSPAIRDNQGVQDNKSSNPLEVENDQVVRTNFQQPSVEVQQVIRQLEARDAEVRAHEMAHLSVAGQYATGMSFTYQTGPDGKQYAIGGEVGIDTSEVAGDPEATLQKAQVIQRAALAPAEPSTQDQRVAQAAAQMMVQARQEIAEMASAEKEEQASQISEADSEGVDQGIDVSQNSGFQLTSGQPENEQAMIPDRQQFALRMQIAAQ